METQPRSRPGSGERPLGELFRELASESSDLMRHELRLARTELRQNVREMARDAKGLAIGGAVAAAGGLALVAFLVALLGDLLGGAYWLGALIVGVLMAGAGVWMARSALRDMRSVSVAPQRTLDSLRTTQTWASAEAAELRTATRDDRRGPGEDEGLLKRVIREIQEDDVTGQAAKIAYYAFLALPPALMAVFGLAGLFGGIDLAQAIQQQAQVALPSSVNEAIITPFIEQVVLQSAPGPFSVGLLLALWGASAVFAGLMTTLNVVYDVEDDRSFIKKRALAMGMMVAGALLFLVAAVTLLAGPRIPEALGLGGAASTVWAIVQWPLAFAFIVVAFWLAYYILPNRDQKASKRVLLKAAAGAAVLWLLATAGFRIYITNFSSYNETYGFLGAFIILLLWLYMTGLVVLAGGELAAEMEKQRA